MSRYLILWDFDAGRAPEDPEERKELLGEQQATVKAQIEASGGMVDWGAFAGETSGYAIFEGSAQELHTFAIQWVPWASFETREILTIDDVIAATEAT